MRKRALLQPRLQKLGQRVSNLRAVKGPGDVSMTLRKPPIATVRHRERSRMTAMWTMLPFAGFTWVGKPRRTQCLVLIDHALSRAAGFADQFG